MSGKYMIVKYEHSSQTLRGSNQDVEFFRSQTWTVKLLNTEDINAMVVPVSMLIIHSLLHEHIFSAVSFPV